MKHFVIAALAPALLCGCASLEPEPCTAEWVEWKTDAIFTPFADAHRGTVKDLADFSRKLDKPGPFTMIMMASKIDDLNDLAEDFQTEIAPELKAAADQCGDPKPFVESFSNFLRREGVEEDLLIWVETLGAVAALHTVK